MQPMARAQEVDRRTRRVGLRDGLGARGRRARSVHVSRPVVVGRATDRLRHRYRQPPRPHCDDDAGRMEDADRGVPRAVPIGHRRQPSADGRRRPRRLLRQAVLDHGQLSRRDGPRHVLRRPAVDSAPPGAGRSGPEDASSLCRARPGSPPLLRAGRAHRAGPRDDRARRAARPRGNRGVGNRPDQGPRDGPANDVDVPRTCRTTRTTCADSAGATTTS